MRRASARVFLAAGSLLALCSLASATEPKVVVTIKPLHALVAQVMAGVGVPELLVKGSASPHTYALRPSETRALQHADLFVRMSETVEPFTARMDDTKTTRACVFSASRRVRHVFASTSVGNVFRYDAAL
jgi:zinc transport system substrate-binding protein